MSQKIATPKSKAVVNLFTSIWLVPILAVLIAGWLAYEYYSQLGEKIEIEFSQNIGLKAKESQIRFKDIQVGTIIDIQLKNDGEGVIVTARMNKEITPYLNDSANFWIVKPQVGFSGISGLDTLISGTYINMRAQKSAGEIRNQFQGIEDLRNLGGDGKYVLLYANDATEILIGSGIFYRGVQAGEIVDMSPSKENNSISIWAYIEPQFAHLVGQESDFWLNSFARVDFKGGKFNLSLAPLTSIVSGGISFSASNAPLTQEELETMAFELKSSKSDNDTVSTRVSSDENIVAIVAHTNEPIGSLGRGSIVKFQGFDIGEVAKTALNFDADKGAINTKISMYIDTNFFKDKNSPKSPKQNFIDAINKGLTAQINATDPITQRQIIEFSYPKTPLASNNKAIIKIDEKSYQIADIKSQSGTLTDNANETLKTLQLSLLKLNKSMGNIDKTLSSFKQLADSYKEGSLHSTQITDMLREITKASKETQKLIQKIEQKPNALIFGGGE